MPIFPNLGDGYLYSEPDNDIQRRMNSVYADAITINQAFWSEADFDTRFYMGEQSIYGDIYGNVPILRRRQYNFNQIRPVVDMISGYQRRNRKSIIAVPLEEYAQQTSDQFTKIFSWVNQQENYLETFSEAFLGACVTGMSLLQVWLDFRNDPISGDLKVDNCPYNTFLIDPFFKKTDLSDCNYIWKRSYVTRAEACSLLPDRTDEILALGGQSRDGKFQYQPEAYNYGTRTLLTYDEFFYRDYRRQKLLVDKQTQRTIEWKSDNDKGLREFLAEFPSVEVFEQDIPTVKLAIVVQGRLLYEGPQPLGIDHYSFIPVFTYFNPQTPYFPWRIQGVVRNMRDPQFLLNRFLIIMSDILESQINSGFKFKENALVNPQDVFMQGQGKGLALKEEAQMTDVEKIMPGDISPGFFSLLGQFKEMMFKTSGVTEENMGSATDDMAGILSVLRQGAGLTTLQPIFDRADGALRLLGKVMLAAVQTNFTAGKVSNILQEQPSQQFYDKAWGRFDVTVEEGLYTATQRQQQFAQMVYLKQAGVPITDEDMLKAATIQNKNDIIENAMKRQQAAEQMQQKQSELQMAELEANVKLAQARATADQGLGIERLSRVQENQALAVERQAEAKKDEIAASLDMIKALKELDTIDLAHIEKLIQLSRVLKEATDRVAEPLPSNAMKETVSNVPNEPLPQEPVRTNEGQP
jgi:hypothetical protein